MVIFLCSYCIIQISRVLNFAKNAIREKREINNDANITTFTVLIQPNFAFLNEAVRNRCVLYTKTYFKLRRIKETDGHPIHGHKLQTGIKSTAYPSYL